MAVTAIKYICQWFDYAGTLSDGDVLEIDTDKMTVKLNDVDVRYNLSGRKKFFKLTVGDQEVQYQDDESSRTADIDVTHSPRWS